jgi:hypothetical protein
MNLYNRNRIYIFNHMGSFYQQVRCNVAKTFVKKYINMVFGQVIYL